MGAWCRTCGLQRGVEVERLQAVALLASLDALEELLQLVVAEAGEREVEAFDRRQVGEHAAEQLVVRSAADPVEGEVEEAGLLQGDVQEDHGHRLVAEAPGCGEALVATDDGLVLSPGQDGLHEAVLAQALRQGFELGVGDAPRVCRVRAQFVDGDLDDLVGS